MQNKSSFLNIWAITNSAIVKNLKNFIYDIMYEQVSQTNFTFYVSTNTNSYIGDVLLTAIVANPLILYVFNFCQM